MNRIKRLLQSFSKHIAVPWRSNAAAAQRVIFCVYHEHDELRLRAKTEEFELAARESGHKWALFDFTDTFEGWLVSQRYAKSYFQQPHLLSTLLPKYLIFISELFQAFIINSKADENTVVAIQGTGSLFGFLKVKDVVDKLAPMVTGRLLIFFPGSCENNNYRLLDGYDGWNYLAVAITADKDF